MEQQLDLNSKCTTVKLVATKKTIELRVCKLQVDLTVQESWVHKFHAPSRTTAPIFNALRMPPPVARDLAALTVDCLKSAAVAWNRKTSVGRKLKGVHWLLLIIAWLRADANYIRILEDAPALAIAHHVDRLQRQCVRCNEIVARSVARPPGYTINPYADRSHNHRLFLNWCFVNDLHTICSRFEPLVRLLTQDQKCVFVCFELDCWGQLLKASRMEFRSPIATPPCW